MEYRLHDKGSLDPRRKPSEHVVRHLFLLFDQVLLEEDARVVSLAISPDPERVYREKAARLQPILDRLYQAAGAEQSPIAHALDRGS